MVKKIITFGLITLIFLLLLPLSATAAGIGTAPSELKITNALRGEEYERTITIFNPDENRNNFTLRIEGQASEWISLYKVGDLTTPIKNISIGRKGNYPILVKINIPQYESKGTYNATLYVATIPKELKDIEVGVGTVLQSTVSITIEVTGNQIIDGIVNAILIENTEPNYPLKIRTVFQNTGNVAVKPKITVTIYQDGNMVSNFTYANTKVKPTNIETIITEWNTTAANAPGDYTANVVVSLDGRVLRSESLFFKILPVGTLTRQGNLTAIIIEGDPVVDTVLKVKSYFQNTGQIETAAKFRGEVYKNGKLIDTLSSEELTVPKNQKRFLISYLKLSSAGDYVVKGKIIYGGKETQVKEVSFKVKDKKLIPGFEGIYAVAMVLVLLMIYRLRLHF